MGDGGISYEIAERFFGWKWIAMIGRPTRDHPSYPRQQWVRRFISPQSLNSENWQAYLAQAKHRDATGDEPLDYCHCSSSGYERPPAFDSSWGAIRELEKELDRRGLLATYLKRTKWKDGCKRRCTVALKCLDETEG